MFIPQCPVVWFPTLPRPLQLWLAWWHPQSQLRLLQYPQVIASCVAMMDLLSDDTEALGFASCVAMMTCYLMIQKDRDTTDVEDHICRMLFGCAPDSQIFSC